MTSRFRRSIEELAALNADLRRNTIAMLLRANLRLAGLMEDRDSVDS